MSDFELLHEVTAAFDCRDVAHLDLAAMRGAFADLMDAAAHAVQCRGLEQDDCVLERWADVRWGPGDAAVTVPIEWLADRDRCIAAIRRHCPSNAGPVSIAALRVRAVRSPPLDPFGFNTPAARPSP